MNDRSQRPIELAPGADENAFAAMLADLVRQNLESKPRKKKDFDALSGTIALICDDADVALTLEFGKSSAGDRGLTLHDGIKGIPDVAVRGSADAIMALSNVPLTRVLGLPLPSDRSSWEALSSMIRSSATGEIKVYGMVGNAKKLLSLTRVMSVNG